MTDPWGALLAEGGRVTLYVAQGGAFEARDFATIGEAQDRSGIPQSRMMVLNDSQRAAPPVPTLPDGPGLLGAVQQGTPAALLPAAARILVAGALGEQPDWDGIVILPEADVTHWVHVSAREIISFQGAATGRLAAALGAGTGQFDEAALGDTMSRPERLAAQLNAAALLGDEAALMGHLLGAELAAMKAYWLGQELRIVGGPAPYAAALASQGAEATEVPRGMAWRAGLVALGAAAGFSS